MRSVLVLHGPNLNRLGQREPERYGTTTLDQIDAALAAAAEGVALETFQSNHEGALIDRLHAAADAGASGVLLNAGAYSHTSLALADAVRAIAPIPVVEVHLTNAVARGRESIIGPACHARVEGFGADSYMVALWALLRQLNGTRVQSNG